MSWLREHCPRLALARDQRAAEMRRERQARREIRRQMLAAEQMVAHRELQLVRAQATGDRRYIDRRTNKLDAGRRQLERLRRRARRLGVE